MEHKGYKIHWTGWKLPAVAGRFGKGTTNTSSVGQYQATRLEPTGRRSDHLALFMLDGKGQPEASLPQLHAMIDAQV